MHPLRSLISLCHTKLAALPKKQFSHLITRHTIYLSMLAPWCVII